MLDAHFFVYTFSSLSALFAQAQASHAAALHNIERAGVMTTAAGLSAVATVKNATQTQGCKSIYFL
jgi:hypothetical protein